MKELDFELAVRSWLREHGVQNWKLHSRQMAGIPDIHAIHEGVACWMELKLLRDSGLGVASAAYTFTEEQSKFLMEVQEAGGVGLFVLGYWQVRTRTWLCSFSSTWPRTQAVEIKDLDPLSTLQALPLFKVRALTQG